MDNKSVQSAVTQSSDIFAAPVDRASKAGRSNIEFYQCRHTFATLLLQGGAEWRYIADQMGHSDLTMLQRHYWKWRPGSIAKPSTDPIAEALFI